MNFNQESKSEGKKKFIWGWGEGGDSDQKNNKKTIGICLFFVLMLYIKFQISSSWLKWFSSFKYDHLQVMETITGKFHQNPLKNVGGVAETRTSVDKMAKTDKGP